eukprot:15347008-Ditylum_brightwellii.AAC.1
MSQKSPYQGYPDASSQREDHNHYYDVEYDFCPPGRKVLSSSSNVTPSFPPSPTIEQLDSTYNNSHEGNNPFAPNGVGASWTDYHHSSHPQIYTNDYSRTQQVQYQHQHQQEHSNNRPHVNISYHSRPDHFQPYTGAAPPKRSCKQPSFDQPKHEDAFIGNNGIHSDQNIHQEPCVDHNRGQSNASLPYVHSPSVSTKLGKNNQQTEPGTWAEATSSYSVPPSYLSHHVPHQNHSFYALHNQHQSSHWYESSPSSSPPGTAMTCHGQSHYAAP